MANFKDCIAADLDAVFFNTSEFAISAIIENEPVDIVVDNEELSERKLRLREGLHTEELLFSVQKTSLSFYPRPGNKVEIDSVKWRVKSVQEDWGLFKIIVELVSS